MLNNNAFCSPTINNSGRLQWNTCGDRSCQGLGCNSWAREEKKDGTIMVHSVVIYRFRGGSVFDRCEGSARAK